MKTKRNNPIKRVPSRMQLSSVILCFNCVRIMQKVAFVPLFYIQNRRYIEDIMRPKTMLLLIGLISLSIQKGPGDVCPNTDGNIIINGCFQVPKVDRFELFYPRTVEKRVPGWTVSAYRLEFGQGSIYNSNWNSGQVAELHGGTAIYQAFKLKLNQKYHIQFDWAERPGYSKEHNKLQIFWNGRPIKTLDEESENVFRERINVNGDRIRTVMHLKGLGLERNGQGSTIDNVMIKEGHWDGPTREIVGEDTPVAKRRPAQPSTCYKGNLVKNGCFQFPRIVGVRIFFNVRHLPKGIHWKMQVGWLEFGEGILYNPNWKSGQVAKLDTWTKAYIYQYVLGMDPKKTYILSFDWAETPKKGKATSSLSVKFSNLGPKRLNTESDDIQHYEMNITKGNRLLRVHGLGNQDNEGSQIDNIVIREFGAAPPDDINFRPSVQVLSEPSLDGIEPVCVSIKGPHT